MGVEENTMNMNFIYSTGGVDCMESKKLKKAVFNDTSRRMISKRRVTSYQKILNKMREEIENKLSDGYGEKRYVTVPMIPLILTGVYSGMWSFERIAEQINTYLSANKIINPKRGGIAYINPKTNCIHNNIISGFWYIINPQVGKCTSWNSGKMKSSVEVLRRDIFIINKNLRDLFYNTLVCGRDITTAAEIDSFIALYGTREEYLVSLEGLFYCVDMYMPVVCIKLIYFYNLFKNILNFWDSNIAKKHKTRDQSTSSYRFCSMIPGFEFVVNQTLCDSQEKSISEMENVMELYSSPFLEFLKYGVPARITDAHNKIK
jgi:hypothetical protein